MDDTTTAAGQAFLSASRSVVIAIGMCFAAYGVVTKSEVIIAGSVVPPVLAAVWGAYVAWQKWHAARAAVIKAVQATTINLTGAMPTVPQAITTVASAPFRAIVSSLPSIPKDLMRAPR
jgi:hypothetical protein